MNKNNTTLKQALPIHVECSTNFEGEQRPEQFFLRDQRIEIMEIVDRWLSTEKRYFKVMSQERDLYILKFDLYAQQWELTLFAKEDYLLGRQPASSYLWHDLTGHCLLDGYETTPV